MGLYRFFSPEALLDHSKPWKNLCGYRDDFKFDARTSRSQGSEFSNLIIMLSSTGVVQDFIRKVMYIRVLVGFNMTLIFLNLYDMG